MKFFLRIISLLFGTVLLVMLHIGISSVCSFPWSTINGIFLGCLLILLRRETGMIVWLSFFCHFFVELYTQHAFGIALSSGTVSMLCTYWLYQYIFTNKSWYTACVLTLSALVIHRVLYSVGLVIVVVSGYEKGVILWPQLFLRYGAEIVLTTIAVTVLYSVCTVFFPVTDASRYRISWYA